MGMVEESVTIKITANGKAAETVALAAARHDMDAGALLSAIKRAQLQPVGRLDARTPLYASAAIDKLLTARPGHGGRPKKAAADR